MNNGTLYVRIIDQDRKRGHAMVVSFERPVVQRTAIQTTTMAGISREYINKNIERFKQQYSADNVIDDTDHGMVRRLCKMFGEEVPDYAKPVKKVKKPE